MIRYPDNFTGVYRHVISLKVPEKELAANFRNALRKIGLNPSFSFYTKKKTYRVRAYSRQFYEWFKRLTPRDLKGMLSPALAPLFVRGFYESEGCLSKIIDRRSPNTRTYQLIMGSTNKGIVKLIQNMVRDMGFSFHFGEYHHPNPNTKTLYRLYISKREEARRFINKIKPCIKNSFPDYYQNP